MTSAEERDLKTGLATLRDDNADDTDGRGAAQASSGEPDDRDTDANGAASPPPAPPVDATTRESWLAAFRAVARRRGGRIRSGQLGDALRLAGFVVTEAEVSQYRAEADPSDEGSIGADAFLALAAKARLEVGWDGDGGGDGGEGGGDFEILRAALAVFDKPLSGRIKAGDLRHWLTSLGEPIADGDVTKMLEHLVDDEGLLDYAELAHRLIGL